MTASCEKSAAEVVRDDQQPGRNRGRKTMKIGVFTVLFAQGPFEQALGIIQETGCEAVEIPTGGVPGNAQFDLDNLVDNDHA